MSEKRYWFYLEPYVHISVKANMCLLYNPLNGEVIELKDKPDTLEIARAFLKKDEFRIVELTEEQVSIPEVSRFIKMVRVHFMGDIFEKELSMQKPFQFPPIYHIQNDVELLKKKDLSLLIPELKTFLHEIFLYVNNNCTKNCTICDSAYKQYTFCTKTSIGQQELDVGSIKRLFESVRKSSMKRCTILGGNVFEYSSYNLLMELLKHYSFKKELFVHYSNLIPPYESRIDGLKHNKITLNVGVHFPLDRASFSQAMGILNKCGIDANLVVLIGDENDLAALEELINEFALENYTFHPYFSNNNLTFFKKYVFPSREDIVNSRPTQKEIIRRNAINPSFFGKLTIMYDGCVYGNINESPIGKAGKH